MPKQPRSLTGQVVAITGAARGIGKATAEACIRRGMRVAIGDLDVATAQEAAAQLGGGTIALPLDVTRRSSIEAFLDEAEARLGGLDVVINNAGIMQVGRFWEEDDATAIRQVDINLHGVILGTKIALERFMPRNAGAIVNIASQAGKYGAPGGATYSATKHGVVGLTEAVHGELRLAGYDGVQMTYVMPILVRTELGAGAQDSRGVKTLQPQDVAEAIVAALRDGTVDVWVPRSVKPLSRLVTILPRPAAEGIASLMKADRVLFDADTDARAGYELRASRSEPEQLTK